MNRQELEAKLADVEQDFLTFNNQDMDKPTKILFIAIIPMAAVCLAYYSFHVITYKQCTDCCYTILSIALLGAALTLKK